MKVLPTEFDDQPIRRVFDEDTETWWFSVVDVVQVLTQQVDYQAARKYWNKLKERLSKEGSESVTNCHRLKLPAADGKNYLTDVATAETLLRLVQSVPSLRPSSSLPRWPSCPPARLPKRRLQPVWAKTKPLPKPVAELRSKRVCSWKTKRASRWCRGKTTWRPSPLKSLCQSPGRNRRRLRMKLAAS